MAPLAIIAALTLTVGWLFARAVHHFFVARFTVLNEVAELGTPRPNGKKIAGTAIICGGSMAGLYAARVCADHFDTVLVVDPEAWLPTAHGTTSRFGSHASETEKFPKRSRVAQYYALHAYQTFSVLALRKLFPNFDAEAKNSDIRITTSLTPGALSGVPPRTPILPTYLHPFSTFPVVHFSSREAFETLLRRLTLARCDNIKWVVGSVVGFKPAVGDRTRIGKVVVRKSGGGDGEREERSEQEEVEEDATLVIDCTGVLQAGVRLLEQAGYRLDLPSPSPSPSSSSQTPSQTSTPTPSPQSHLRTTYNPKMRYTCFILPIPSSKPDLEKMDALIPGGYANLGGIAYAFFPDPKKEKRTFVLARIEGDRIHIACGGWAVSDIERPRTVSDIKAFVRNLKGAQPVPQWILDLVDLLTQDLDPDDEDAVDCDDVKVQPCSYVRYHKASDIPSNFVALGDATMRVNPIFGQGCTKACMNAVTLNTHLLHSRPHKTLRGGSEIQLLPSDFGRKFFAASAAKMQPIWDGTRLPDYSFPTTVPAQGEIRETEGATMKWWSGLVTRAAWKDDAVNSVSWHIRNFLAPAVELFYPEIVLRVLWSTLF